MDITYKDAIQRVGAELQADPHLFYAFQANIAMLINDALIKTEAIKPGKFEAVNDAINQVSKEFLSVLGDFRFPPATTALEKISQERHKQIYRYGYDAMHDEYKNGELIQAALFSVDPTDSLYGTWPQSWGEEARQRIIDREPIDRLTVAASLLASQIDRLLFEKRIQKGPRTLDECINRYLHRFKYFPVSILEKGEDYFANYCHSHRSGGIGMGIRNELGLWVQDSPLHQYFLSEHNLFEADAMSALILRGIYRELTKPQEEFVIEGNRFVRVTILAPTVQDAINYFKRDFPDSSIDVINDREYIANCLYSGLPIFEDDDYTYNGEYWLKAHGPSPDQLAAETHNQSQDDNE